MSKIAIALYIAATTLGLIFLKLGAKTGLPVSYVSGKLHTNFTAYSVAGLGLYGLSFIVYIYLISKYDLGYIIPLLAAFVYVLIFVASYFVFDEVFTTAKIVGIAMILGGIVFLNINK